MSFEAQLVQSHSPLVTSDHLQTHRRILSILYLRILYINHEYYSEVFFMWLHQGSERCMRKARAGRGPLHGLRERIDHADCLSLG